MNLQDKYKQLLDYARSSNVESLSVSENNNVLYVSGKASVAVKDKLWEVYNAIDPDMRSGDLVLNIEASGSKEIEASYVIKPGDNLSAIAKKYSGMTWQKIYEANKDTIKDPNLIYPGKTIRIPKA